MDDDLPCAPFLPRDLPWVGASGAPVLGDGRVGLVLFWSANSVHCERALATLAWLELRFAGRPLVVASVHVPRDPLERGTDFVARACARQRVRHPVCVDDSGASLTAWGGRVLPTLAVVDAAGLIRYAGGGEPDRERLGAAVAALLDEAKAPPPPPVEAAWPEPPPRSVTALRFPTGLSVDADAGLLWIADTGRDRVIAVGLDDGSLRHCVGVGRPGATDGDFGCAAFASPRGLAAEAGRCYVADAGNHLVRCIDVDERTVETLLGQGRLVTDIAGGLPGSEQGIAAPWDVEVVGDELYIAMAGVHQIWQLALTDGFAYAWSGVGHASFSDGMRHSAAFAQPAALAFACDELAVADADNGAIRLAGIATQHVHSALGPDGATRLAQPRGVAWHRGDLLVADTLNNRIVRVGTRDGSATVAVPEAAGLCGPEALAVHGDLLFVADVGNHRVIRVDLESGEVAPFEIGDPHPDHPEPEPPPLLLRAGAQVLFSFSMQVPSDERLHPDGRGYLRARGLSGTPLARPFEGPVDLEGSWGKVHEVATGPPGEGEIELVVRFATCSEFDAEPHLQELSGRFSVRLESEAADAVELPLA